MTKGRPRLKGPREPNGKLSRRKADIAAAQFYRDETEQQTMRTGVSQRARLYAIPEDVARKQEAGTLIGRMYLAGDLGDLRDQGTKQIAAARLDAARVWLETRNRLEWAIDAPDRPRVPREGNGVGDPERTVEAVKAALAAWDSLVGYVRATPGLSAKEVGDLIGALDAYVVREETAPGLFGPLCRALDRIDEFTTRARKGS